MTRGDEKLLARLRKRSKTLYGKPKNDLLLLRQHQRLYIVLCGLFILQIQGKFDRFILSLNEGGESIIFMVFFIIQVVGVFYFGISILLSEVLRSELEDTLYEAQSNQLTDTDPHQSNSDKRTGYNKIHYSLITTSIIIFIALVIYN